MGKQKLNADVGLVMDILKSTKNSFEKLKASSDTLKPSKHYLSARLRELEANFSKTKNLHHSIISFDGADPEDLKVDYCVSDLFGQIQELYFSYSAELLDALEKFASTESVQSPLNSSAINTTHDVKLPRINIKSFTGNYDGWSEFYNMYRAMVHDNKSLTPTQKLFYLKSFVDDDAARLIAHITMDGANYESAWSILLKRYEHKRLLLNTHLKLLTSQPLITNESSDSIKNLLDTSNECIHSLRNLGRPVDQWDDILIYILIQKLPPHTQQLWEERLGATREPPIFKEFAEFLENRFRLIFFHTTQFVKPLAPQPRLQKDIVDILTRWRMFKYAMVADIEKMYRQIWIAPQDAPYQLILWRDNMASRIQTFELQTVTFGTSSAPYLAIRTLHQLAKDEEANHPLASKAITEGFYVDDFIYGADTISHALLIQKDTINVLHQAGFPLRKWASNSPELLENIAEKDRENLPLDFDLKSSIKTLGIRWHPEKDLFSFSINLPEQHYMSKRSVLSAIARLFDPLGWLSPCVIKAKLIMQELWIKNVDWDEQLDADLEVRWKKLRDSFVTLSYIELPRWLGFESTTELTEIHAFCDASELAYCAVVYLRTLSGSKCNVQLIMAKTKVAPLKKISLARLELCGALLLAKLIYRIRSTMDLQNVATFAWCDSTITLAWIKGSPHTRTTFVANRVSEIQQITNPNIWQHVSSKLNPADLGSRGLMPKDLIRNQLWWSGPSFLHCINATILPTINFNTELESKKQSSMQHTTKSTFLQIVLPKINRNFYSILSNAYSFNYNEFLTKFSSLNKLLRIVAYCLRFINNVKHPKKRIIGELSTDEIIHARMSIVKTVQQEVFTSVIDSIQNGKEIAKGSRIRNLSPFLDENGLLRVGGRLENANMPYSQKHPLIIPSNHQVTHLFVRDCHYRTQHGKQQAMMSYLRINYWIPGLRNIVKKCIHHCVKCFRFKAQAQSQIMANLPPGRVQPSRPFTETGVDYAGPIEIKMWKGRCNRFMKGYICIFVCFATKAIHIELVSDLTSSAFIASYKRFVARRGICSHIHSDCGTNFIGAFGELNRDKLFYSKHWNSDVAQQLSNLGTQWHFNPPSSPHFGGLWEAGVKSIKHHLRRILGTSRLTFEEYTTVLAQIESSLNSRPLCPISDDPQDFQVITPGYFLIGGPMNAVPEPNLSQCKIGHLNRWKYLQRLYQNFWSIWQSEYLTRLQQRTKWHTKETNIRIGDIVLLKETNQPPTYWSLGRIIATHPGSDGVIRVVTVKTEKSELKRPLVKVCRLPFNQFTPKTDNEQQII